MDKRVEERRRNFKKSFEDPRRKREELQVQIRKTAREENLHKKRAQIATVENWEGQAQSQGGSELKKETLDMLVQQVFSDDPVKQQDASHQFRKELSIEQNPPIQAVIDAGVVPKFVEFLKRDDTPVLQFEAAWSLTNIASGSAEQTRVVIDNGAVPIFVHLLSSPNDDVREQAVWALGNIAGDSYTCRDLVLHAQALEPLLHQLKSSDKFSMLRNGTWTLSNLCRGKPPPDFDLVRPALPVLANLIHNVDVEVLTDACWALSYLSDGPNMRIDAVISASVVPRLVDLLLHHAPMVQTPALRTIGNIVTGNDAQTQTVISQGALPSLMALLNNTKRAIQKEACWTISNITAGTKDQIQEVISHGLIVPLVNLLSCAQCDIQKEAAWAIANAASGGTQSQVDYLISCGILGPLLRLLDIDDHKIIKVILEAIENILVTGKTKQKEQNLPTNPYCDLMENEQGLNKLEYLQDNPNQDIYLKCYRLITTYFPYAEENQGEEFGNATTFDASAPTGGFKFA